MIFDTKEVNELEIVLAVLFKVQWPEIEKFDPFPDNFGQIVKNLVILKIAG